MSLITIKRTPTQSDSIDAVILDDCDNFIENTSQNEDYFASNGTVILQNSVGRRRSSIIKEGDNIQNSLVKTTALLRPEDKLKLIVSLEGNYLLEGQRYFCVIVTNGNQNKDEFLILGVNISYLKVAIGFVLPICQDMSVTLDGDGGFKIKTKDGEKWFKPSSVQALWSTVQLLNKACSIAHRHNYYIGGLSHTWIDFYISQISSSRAEIAEWNKMIYADTVTNSSLAPKSAIGELVFGTCVDETASNKDEIRRLLKDIMRDQDLDCVTVIFLRERLQEVVSFDLKNYKSFIAEEILIIYGQMDSASQILPYLYLGSTYNSSNLDELLANKITHILNVTKESENFFREKFIYQNVEVYDVEETNLLRYFNGCYQFINDAKLRNSVCLVHCQRGISRSATVVIAYMMKEFNLTRDDALRQVKRKRECIHPNDGFMAQLKTYEGILTASAQRHNLQFVSDKRSQLVSLPNQLYQINEQDNDTEYSPNNGPISMPRPASYSTAPTSSDSPLYASLNLGFDNQISLDEQSSLSSMKTDIDEFSFVTSVTTQGQPRDPAKPGLRLKDDVSWIKAHSVDQSMTDGRDEDCHSLGSVANGDNDVSCVQHCANDECDAPTDADQMMCVAMSQLVTSPTNTDS